MRSNIDTEIGPASSFCDIWWSLRSSCFSWKWRRACHPWNPVPSVWQWHHHTFAAWELGIEACMCHPSCMTDYEAGFSLAQGEHRPEKRPQLPSVLKSIIQEVAGEKETLLMFVVRWNKGRSVQGVLHDSGSDLQIPSWGMLMADGCVWMPVLFRRGLVSSWILRGPFVSWMLFSSSVPIT